MELVGQGGVRDAALALEDLEHPAVGAVQGHDPLLKLRSGADHCARGMSRGASEHHMPPIPRDTASMLSTRTATALYVGAVLGPGVLILPALAAEAAGPASVLAWVGLLALSAPLAIAFAALGVRQPEAGGTAAYARAAFGSRAGGRHRLVVPGRRGARRARRGPDRRLLRGRAGRRRARGRRGRRRRDDGGGHGHQRGRPAHLGAPAARPRRRTGCAAAGRHRHRPAGEPRRALGSVRAARRRRDRHRREPADALLHRLGGRLAPGRRACRPGAPAPARDLRRARRRRRALPRPGRRHRRRAGHRGALAGAARRPHGGRARRARPDGDRRARRPADHGRDERLRRRGGQARRAPWPRRARHPRRSPALGEPWLSSRPPPRSC